MESSVTMYLVELRPGKEELYRTGDELAAAIRAGDVDMHSRIYHRATSKWISVTLHPQYKAIVAERPPAPQLPPLERSNWTFFNDSADGLAGASDASEESLGLKDGDDTDPNWRRPLALSITGGLLILGLQLAATGPKPPWATREVRTAPTQLQAAARPVSGTVTYASMSNVSNQWRDVESSASVGTQWSDVESYAPMAEERAAPAKADTARPALPAAPRIRQKVLLKDVLAMKAVPPGAAAPAPTSDARATAPAPTAPAKLTVATMLQRWSAAHDSARARLESGIRVSRLNQLFAPGRLSPGGGVTETRMSLAGLANFVRVYRQQQLMIERQYQDSFSVAATRMNWSPETVRDWYAKPARRESPALAGLTTSLIDGIDSLLGVLDAQAGTYTLTKNVIKFEDPGAARQYAALRERITATVDSARVAGGRDDVGPMGLLLQAIGTTRLPIAS
jgi:hypothetical protein